MADRRNSGYARKANDLYCTPAWVTEELLRHVRLGPLVWEPACGNGHMADVLGGTGGHIVIASDVEPGIEKAWKWDFLTVEPIQWTHGYPSAIVTNPPFSLSQEFADTAIKRMMAVRGQVCLLLPADWDHAASRSHLFTNGIFARKIVLTKRIRWFAGTADDRGKQPMGNHAWFVWDWRHYGPPALSYMLPSIETAARKPRKPRQERELLLAA